jgi:hypothetical protein
VIEAVARVDGSTAWCMFNSGGLAISAAFLHDDAADAIHGRDPRSIMSGTRYPPGRAIPSQGGYIVSGRWVYASGCWHASWHLGECNVYEPGVNEPRRDQAGIPEIINDPNRAAVAALGKARERSDRQRASLSTDAYRRRWTHRVLSRPANLG